MSDPVDFASKGSVLMSMREYRFRMPSDVGAACRVQHADFDYLLLFIPI